MIRKSAQIHRFDFLLQHHREDVQPCTTLVALTTLLLDRSFSSRLKSQTEKIFRKKISTN
jgi:hypothetical protein